MSKAKVSAAMHLNKCWMEWSAVFVEQQGLNICIYCGLGGLNRCIKDKFTNIVQWREDQVKINYMKLFMKVITYMTMTCGNVRIMHTERNIRAWIVDSVCVLICFWFDKSGFNAQANHKYLPHYLFRKTEQLELVNLLISTCTTNSTYGDSVMWKRTASKSRH